MYYHTLLVYSSGDTLSGITALMRVVTDSIHSKDEKLSVVSCDFMTLASPVPPL